MSEIHLTLALAIAFGGYVTRDGRRHINLRVISDLAIMDSVLDNLFHHLQSLLELIIAFLQLAMIA